MDVNILVIGVTAGIAFLLTFLSGFIFIPMLKKLKYGQTILEIGPSWHKNKEGTPTMGGLMFIVGILVAVVVGFIMSENALYSVAERESGINNIFFAGLGFIVAMALIGFFDDYIKVVKKRNKGLSAKQKTVLQVLTIGVYLGTLGVFGQEDMILTIPFLEGGLYLWYFYYVIIGLAIYFIVNAVNLTYGVDGLCSSVTFFVALAFMFIYTLIIGKQDANMQILSVALAAGCLGFLMWNFHPAKVFMGDVGSLFLGGAVVVLGMSMGAPILLLFAGIIYIIEALTVVIQVASFQLRGKRIFKMTPIHHHFEMSGWSEVKIVLVFSGVTIVGGILAYIGACNI